MADQRYLVWKTEPNTHYASRSLALATAEEAARADEGATYLVREAIMYDVSSVSTGDVTTIVRDRWDSFLAGYNMDEASLADRTEILGGTSLLDTSSSVVANSGKIPGGNSIEMLTSSDDLRAATTDYRVTTDQTIIFWLRPLQSAWNDGNTDLMIYRWGAGNWDWRFRSITGRELEFRIDDSSSGDEAATFPGSDSMSVDTWYFFSIVYDSVTKRVTCGINASEFNASPALTNGIAINGDELRINATGSVNTWDMDGLYFFSEAKTVPWIVDQYREGVGRLYPENPEDL